ncbi:MAG: hypothetical protein ACEQSH_01030, partial [Bacteroidia bacterium]
MKTLLLSMTASLVFAGGAAHSQDAASSPQAPTAAEVLTGVSPQTREEQIGETRTYVSETVQAGPGNVASRNRQTFTLETMALTRNKILMRYRLTSAEAEDATRPYLAGLLQAYIDVPSHGPDARRQLHAVEPANLRSGHRQCDRPKPYTVPRQPDSGGPNRSRRAADRRPDAV